MQMSRGGRGGKNTEYVSMGNSCGGDE